MRLALLLVDLQQDFLAKPHLEPSAGEIVERTRVLLEGCRRHSLPIIHIWTTIFPEKDNRMPHWQQNQVFLCQNGTLGHAVPQDLTPQTENEFIIHKSFYSGFESGELDPLLQSLDIDTLLVAGIYLHGCIRATVLDAYQRGYQIWVAEDATGSDDGLHGAITLNYLQERAAQFTSVEGILGLLSKMEDQTEPYAPILPYGIAETPLIPDSSSLGGYHRSPRNLSQTLWQVPNPDADTLSLLVKESQKGDKEWQYWSLAQRQDLLCQFASLLEAEKDNLIEQLAIEVGKPISNGLAEVDRAIALLRTVATYGEDALGVFKNKHQQYRYLPTGKIALITPWNNPLAIPIGKIAPALLYGNTVIWKPAPAGSGIAVTVKRLFDQLACPSSILTLVLGDRSTAMRLMSDPIIDAVSLSGSSLAGYTAQEICGRRRIPLQAELGGNNGAIVWSDCDFPVVAQKIVEGAFSFAGQRCTANRRVVVDATCYEPFVESLVAAMENLKWGDPLDTLTQVGPLISQKQCQRVAAIVERAKLQAQRVYQRSQTPREPLGSYYPPTMIECDDPNQEVVQAETFGPVLVVQKASHWEQAIALNNSVKQGLVSALFSTDKERQAQFLQQAKAGVLKINAATADVAVDLPFGGWKHSSIGVPEHGISNRDFYTRIQTVYWE